MNHGMRRETQNSNIEIDSAELVAGRNKFE